LSGTEKEATSLPTPKSVVTHNVADVSTLVDQAVDVLWPSRYGTKSWDCLRPESISVGSDSATVEARSQAVYQRLVFDMTAQAITTLCNDTATSVADDTSQPWRHRPMTVSQPAPQSVDEAKLLIKASVLKHLGLEAQRPPLLPRSWSKVRGRRQADRVDEVLAVELVEDESAWTDRTDDEMFVKMQVTEMLFNMMVSDTVGTLSGVIARKCQRCH